MHNYEVESSQTTDKRREEKQRQNITRQFPSMTDIQTEKNSDREPPGNDHRTNFGDSGVGLKLALLDRNLLNPSVEQHRKHQLTSQHTMEKDR